MSTTIRTRAATAGSVALAGVIVALAVYADEVPVEKIETVQDATAHLRSSGATDEQIAARLATALTVEERLALEIVKRSYGRGARDERSLRSAELFMVTADAPTSEAAVGVAWCAPLAGLAEHATCVANQRGWFGGSLCDGTDAVTARWAALHARPAEARRLVGGAEAGRYEVHTVDRTGFDAILRARSLHVCDPVEAK